MKTVLAIETTTQICTVALKFSGETFCVKAEKSNSHADSVLSLIDDVLLKANIEMKQLDAIAIATGPGSFTGIRIGISVVQGLAYGLNIPVVCVNSLEVMAHQIVRKQQEAGNLHFNAVCPAIDARMGDIYWQFFSYPNDSHMNVSGNKSLPTLCEPQVGKPDEFIAAINDRPETLAFGGSGFFCDGMKPFLKANNLDELNAAQYLLEIALHKLGEDIVSTAFEIEPHYVRTEITWKKRERIRQP